MVKKIKVVELNTSNPEATAEPNVEQEAAPDPTPMQEPESVEPVAIPDSMPEEKAKKPRQPRKPRAPKELKLVREPRKEVPPPSESDSIDTEEMVAVIKNHRASKKPSVITKEEPPEPPPPPAAPVAKEEEKATCPDCHKVMSAKSLKYTHFKNCRAKQPSKEEPVIMVESVESSKPVQHPISVLMAAERAMRIGQRRQRIESLLSNAF